MVSVKGIIYGKLCDVIYIPEISRTYDWSVQVRIKSGYLTRSRILVGNRLINLFIATHKNVNFYN